MIRLKKHLKETITSAALGTGFLPRYVAGKLSGCAAVLMYHRVLPDPVREKSFSADGIIVSPATFLRQMETVRRRFHPLTLSDYVAHLEEGRFPDGSCLVTFDDGWFDNYEFALPILQATEVPAVVFVATDYIGTSGCFWQESLSRLLATAAEDRDIASTCFSGLARPDVPDLRPGDRKPAIRQCIDVLKRRPASELFAITNRIEKILGDRRIARAAQSPDRFMSWQEVLALRDSGLVSVGSHCRSHVPLTQLPLSDAERELVESRAIIASQVGAMPVAVAYPNGDCNSSIGSAARQAGYSVAFTTERGYSTATENRFLQRRINVHEHSTDSEGAFLARIALLT